MGDYIETAGAALLLLSTAYTVFASSKNGNWNTCLPRPFRTDRDLTGAALTGGIIMRRWHKGKWEYRDLTGQEQFGRLDW